MDMFSLDLSLIARLGSHSALRTQRGKGRFPGMTITCVLIQIITKARVTELITTDGACTGCVYEKGGTSFKEFGPVIIASGGLQSWLGFLLNCVVFVRVAGAACAEYMPGDRA